MDGHFILPNVIPVGLFKELLKVVIDFVESKILVLIYFHGNPIF